MVVFQNDETEEQTVQLLPISVSTITPEVLRRLPVVAAEELGWDFNKIIQRLENGGGPIRIRWEGEPNLILSNLKDYTKLFLLLSADEKGEEASENSQEEAADYAAF